MISAVHRLVNFSRADGRGAGRPAPRDHLAALDPSSKTLTLLRRLVIAYLPITAALAAAAAVDPRTLAGEEVWVKPMKFSVSIGLNGAALLWLARRSPPGRLVRGATVLSAVSLVVEQALITLQGARGVRSHYNTDTPFDRKVYAAMGLSLAGGPGLATLVLAALSVVRPPSDPVVAKVARSGLGLMLGSFAVGLVMSERGTHSVGVPDGGPGLPLVGWSSVAGDLRPAHFVGLHGLQLLIAADHLLRHRPAAQRMAVTRTLTWATGGLMTALGAQALAGAPTLSRSAAAVAGVTAAAAAVGAGSARRTTRPTIG